MGIELASRRRVIWLGTGRNQCSTARHLNVDLNPAWMWIFGGFSLIQSGGANTLAVPSKQLTTALSWFRLLGRSPAGGSIVPRKVTAAWYYPSNFIKNIQSLKTAMHTPVTHHCYRDMNIRNVVPCDKVLHNKATLSLQKLLNTLSCVDEWFCCGVCGDSHHHACSPQAIAPPWWW